MTVVEAPAGATGDAPVQQPVVEVDHVSVAFASGSRRFRAVNDVSLTIAPRETLGLVGESGCGKSTLARAVLKLVPVESGTVHLLGQDLATLHGSALRGVRRHAQMIFQDPRGSLDPRMTIGEIIGEPLRVHRIGDRRSRAADVAEMMDLVGLPASFIDRRPSQLSGGQQQRVGIARALVTRPALVVCDEPVSALDVSIRAQVMNLLADLRDSLDVAFMFIAHDLAVVRHLSDRVAVMYLGRIVEEGPADELFANPRHPYTQGLVAAILRADNGARDRLETVQRLASGDLPSPVNPPKGCAYHTRCPYALDDPCVARRPLLSALEPDAATHRVACHRVAEIPRIDSGVQ
ncbi:MAG TPA: oligopeptide/dipeptide ABC transporter ATP-binding protein [Ilumatobacter sp.]|nr:oligopeptide/dipeptide ABC transporter ATP-binding protein [Ilumatobacter sp.]